MPTPSGDYIGHVALNGCVLTSTYLYDCFTYFLLQGCSGLIPHYAHHAPYWAQTTLTTEHALPYSARTTMPRTIDLVALMLNDPNEYIRVICGTSETYKYE